MSLSTKFTILLFVAVLPFSPGGLAQKPDFPSGLPLGPGDELVISVPEVDELKSVDVVVESDGRIGLPLVGAEQVAGLTAAQAEEDLKARLRVYMTNPQVSVSVKAIRSQEVHLIGALVTPGTYQLQGNRTLGEMITAAGGLKSSAGSRAEITRRIEAGSPALPNGKTDPSGKFESITVDVFDASGEPNNSIVLAPHDVVTIEQAPMVFVIGEVNKQGGYSANDVRSVLQAVSTAGGATKVASLQHARILRSVNGGLKRDELNINVRAILAGKAEDVAMRPNDILVIPNNNGKTVMTRSLETMIAIGTSALTYGLIR